MKGKNLPSLEDLLRSNPKADPELVASARAKIEEIRKNGFKPAGYRLTGRRIPLLEKKPSGHGKERLPRRHR
jgi:hypothetical protein